MIPPFFAAENPLALRARIAIFGGVGSWSNHVIAEASRVRLCVEERGPALARLPRPGGVPERPKGTGCKPVGSAYGGSNPPAPTLSFWFSVTAAVRVGLAVLVVAWLLDLFWLGTPAGSPL